MEIRQKIDKLTKDFIEKSTERMREFTGSAPFAMWNVSTSEIVPELEATICTLVTNEFSRRREFAIGARITLPSDGLSVGRRRKKKKGDEEKRLDKFLHGNHSTKLK